MVLSIAALGVLVIEPVNRALGAFSVGLPFPSVTTGFGFANEVEEPYSPFSPPTHPGSILLVTAIVDARPGQTPVAAAGDDDEPPADEV